METTFNAPSPVPVSTPPIPMPAQAPVVAASYMEAVSQSLSSAWETTTSLPGKFYNTLPACETCKSVSEATSSFFTNVKGRILDGYTYTADSLRPADNSVIYTVASYGSNAFQFIAPVVAGGVLANSTISIGASVIQGKANIKLQNPELKKAAIAAAVTGLAIYLNPSYEGKLAQVASLFAAASVVGAYKASTAVAPIYIMLPEGLSFEEPIQTEANEAAAETVVEQQTPVQEEVLVNR
jgi:hypothetical protein